MKRSILLIVLFMGILPVLPDGMQLATFAQTADPRWQDTGPPPGIYFYWYEPTFYTGFAPRCQDPARIHIRLARGNQLRLSVTLGPEQIGNYLEDLLLRRRIVEELLKKGIIDLTQNKEFEAFSAALDQTDVAGAVGRRNQIPAEEYRDKSLEIMKKLNPGRVFHIRRPADAVFERWSQILRQQSAKMDSPQGRLELLNELLPGRINLLEINPENEKLLGNLLELSKQGKLPQQTQNRFFEETARFLDRITRSIYQVKNGFIDSHEFTAIYPAGTANAWVTWQGKRLPDFTVTGIWPLIPRTKGKGIVGMVDYISTNPGYGFVPMLPYQYAGGIEYNAYHNPGVRCPLAGSKILPKEWQQAAGIRDPKKPFTNLWIVSRGPVSHGCTRLAAGHILEMRHILPSRSEDLEKVVTFRTLPQCYDLFDIDGDGKTEVMGVKFYLAFAHTEDRIPYKVYAANSREPFYEWLYAGEAKIDEAGKAWFPKALSGTFAGRKAHEGNAHENVPLWEAEYEPDRIQFFKIRPISFESPQGFELIRELGKIATGYNHDSRKLMLESGK